MSETWANKRTRRRNRMDEIKTEGRSRVARRADFGVQRGGNEPLTGRSLTVRTRVLKK
jgi:hypothetical protein